MNKFRNIVAAAALAACAAGAPAQQNAAPNGGQTTVQDGIEVRPLSRLRVLAPAEVVESQSKQQYLTLMQQASQKGVLAPTTDPQVVRLRGIAKRLIPFTPRWNGDAAKWDWQVNLIASKEVNAFCMPGGRIGFYSGILTQLNLSDDEAAAVMGHEVAHALREHSRAQMVKTAGTNTVFRLGGALIASVFGLDPGVTDMAAQAGGQLLTLRFSRDDEREADLIGLDIAARAGFDPRAGIVLWEKMATLNKRAPPQFISTHPGGGDRIERMKAHMNVLLPVYARAKGTKVQNLPPYRSMALN
ncbi:M48 family metallopeptidase [Massilia sp. CF038]|uniref:M48 family metallopeptidase n=1 Tax=Massilia sp. CF038 TaxID=1881045 RepID=UPI0009245889|nr:M48 family metallopeptidase [Massilia sp. CF038]SHH29783.1 Peptidase family M48 [Massilia sp. CF038]